MLAMLMLELDLIQVWIATGPSAWQQWSMLFDILKNTFYLTPKVLFNLKWVLGFCMLNEVSNFVFSIFKIFYGCREFKKLCENLIFTKSVLMV